MSKHRRICFKEMNGSSVTLCEFDHDTWPCNAGLRKLVVDWKNSWKGFPRESLGPLTRCLYDAAGEIEKQDAPPKKTIREIVEDWLEDAVSDERVDELIASLNQAILDSDSQTETS